MWIKTQDGTTLTQCNDFTIYKKKKKPGYFILAGQAGSGKGYNAGWYSSEGKALKVLQMIEDYIFIRDKLYTPRKSFQFPNNEDVKE